MDHCNSVSPEIVVLANEIIEGLGHYSRGVPVETSDFALDVISRVAPGGHYLGEEHTLKNFKNIWYPKFFSRAMINQETSALRPGIRQFLQNIAQSQSIPDLNEKLLTELAKWDQKLAQRIQTS
jgi:trimethylamine--corrinoid protein Co-methyltransferase